MDTDSLIYLEIKHILEERGVMITEHVEEKIEELVAAGMATLDEDEE